MSTTFRKYVSKDYDRVISFFRKLYQAHTTVPYWLPQRFEYAEFLVSPLHEQRGITTDWKETIYFWEADNKKIVGLICSEYPDENIFIFTLPDFEYLENEMIDKGKIIINNLLNKTEIRIWCEEHNISRQTLLSGKGYKKQTEIEYLNWCELNMPITHAQIPQSYFVQDMTDENNVNLQKKIDNMTEAFDSESYPRWIYRNMQKGTFYRKDLDLYITDEKGDMVSFSIIWYDDVLKIGYFEPVCTVQKHRRKGLGKSLLYVGLARLKRIGAQKAFVGASGNERMEFYDKSGFKQRIIIYPWSK